MRHLSRAEEISAPPELSFEYGRLWLTSGRPDRAVPLLIRSATDLSYDPDTWFWLARAQLERGLPEEAAATIRQGLSRLDPSGESTVVTSFYDWSQIDQHWRDANIFPIVSELALRATLGILDRTVRRGYPQG